MFIPAASVVGVLAALLALGGCDRGAGERQPGIVHWDRDRDEFCGMVVSDRRFAAQAIEPGGRVHAFDDMGCLVQWLDGQPWRQEARLWVRDRHADRWIDPEQARWRAGEQTPSGHGFGASLNSDYGTLTFAEVRRGVLARRGAAAHPSGAPPAQPSVAPVRP